MKFFYCNGKNLDGSLKMFQLDRTIKDECEAYCRIENIKNEVYKYYPTSCTELKANEVLSQGRYQDIFHKMTQFLKIENIQTVHSVSILGSIEADTVNINHQTFVKEYVDINAKIIGSEGTVLDANSIQVRVFKRRDTEYFEATIPVRCFTVGSCNKSTVTYLNPIPCVEDCEKCISE